MAASIRNLRSALGKRKKRHKQVPVELRKKGFELARKLMDELSPKLDTSSSKDEQKK